jgi:hypothetical protein
MKQRAAINSSSNGRCPFHDRQMPCVRARFHLLLTRFANLPDERENG